MTRRQLEDRRVLRGARDEVPGGRHESDPEPDCERAETRSRARRGHAGATGGRRAGGARRSCRLHRRREHPAGSDPHDRGRRARRARGRCATSTTVRSARSRSIASPTSAALSRSRSAVGSSRTTSGASRRNARASAIRRRCPVESSRPPSPTRVSYRSGKRGDEAVRARVRGRLADAPVVGGRVSEPDVVGDRPAEEGRPLRDVGGEPPPRGCVDGREVVAAHEDPTRRRVGQPEQQRHERALSSPARPDDGDRLAGLELEGDVVQHVDVARRIAERHALERDRLERRPGAGRPWPRATARSSARSSSRVGDGVAVGARVELRGEVAERQVELRREHEHGQRRLERRAARPRGARRPRRPRARSRASPRARAPLRTGTRRAGCPSSPGGSPRSPPRRGPSAPSRD